MTNTELELVILEWAKATLPEPYAKTIAASAKPADVYRRFLLRLIELRVASDKAFARTLPLSVLDETSIVLHATRGGKTTRLGGAKATEPYDLRFSLLALVTSMTDFDMLLSASATLDLELVSIDNDDDTDNRIDYTKRAGDYSTGDARSA